MVQWPFDLALRVEDFVEFRAYRPSRRSVTKHVGFTLAEHKRRSGHDLARRLAGVDGGFGGGWKVGAQSLADLLTEAKKTWSGPA